VWCKIYTSVKKMAKGKRDVLLELKMQNENVKSRRSAES